MGMGVVVGKSPTCGGNDGCGLGLVRGVLLVEALVVPKIALTASQNLAVHWRFLREQRCGGLSLRQNERAEIGILTASSGQTFSVGVLLGQEIV